MNKLEWFKFSPSDWTMGRISRVPISVQGEFIRLCCVYWNRGCNMTLAEIQVELSPNAYKRLCLTNIIKMDGVQGRILFLDSQMQDIDYMRQQASKAGKASAEARKFKVGLTTVQRNPTDKEKDIEVKDIYRGFAHLKMSMADFNSLEKEWSKDIIDHVIDSIENFEGNTRYKSLYLTAKTWLKDKPKKVDAVVNTLINDTFANNVMKQLKDGNRSKG